MWEKERIVVARLIKNTYVLAETQVVSMYYASSTRVGKGVCTGLIN